LLADNIKKHSTNYIKSSKTEKSQKNTAQKLAMPTATNIFFEGRREGHWIKDCPLYKKTNACSTQKFVLAIEKNQEGNSETNDNIEEH
jgi:hypothetical protein